jgi:asparagine synthase (glutamine-hydrolysing)
MGLPYRLRSSKKVLRQILVQKGLPSSIYKQKKKGFGIPVSSWLRGPLRAYAESLLTGRDIEQRSVLSAKGVAKIWGEHQARKRDYRKELWSILAFRVWEQSDYGPHGTDH